MPRSWSVALQPKIRGISGIPHPQPPKNLEILSYPYKIDWRRLTNVSLWCVYWK